MKLRTRLYIVVSVVLVVFAGLGVLVIRVVEASELQQVDSQLRSASPAAALSRPRPDQNVVTPRPQPANPNFVSDFYVARLDSPGRSILVRPVDTGQAEPATPPVTTAPGSHNLRPATVGSVAGTARWRAVLIGEPTTGAKLLVAVPLAHVDATMTRLRVVVGVAGIVLLVVLAAAAYWVARLGLRPIAEVTEVADAITSGDRTRRVGEVPTSTEAGHLAKAFNLMLDEQQGTESRLRQFVADASHELRTPVSAILGITGLWRQGALEGDEARDDAIRRIGQAGTRMARLVEDLLLLARLDEGRSLTSEPVNLSTMAREVVEDLSAVYPSRQIRLDCEPTVMAQGDEIALRQVMVNLATNALKHTPSTSSVELRAVQRAESALLVVSDAGPGMDPDGVAHAFDRFWRADASRARAGTGLGLPIVAGIVAAHHGRLDFDTNPERGTTVTILLPGAAQAAGETGDDPDHRGEVVGAL
jgi:two-component system OmpR family sensor kinase